MALENFDQTVFQYYGSYQDKFRLCMFMELVPEGTLQRFYQTKPLSAALLASKYTIDILHGLKYLHDHNVVHRDIKCANILVAQESAKLADFGVAKIIRKNNIRSFQGSVCWMAPEVVRAQMDNIDYGLPADIWSLGCTVLEMLTKKVPYPDVETDFEYSLPGTSNPHGQTAPFHSDPTHLLRIYSSLHQAHHQLSTFLSATQFPQPQQPIAAKNSLSSTGNDPMEFGSHDGIGEENSKGSIERVEEQMRGCFIKNKGGKKRQLSPSAAAAAEERWLNGDGFVGSVVGFDPHESRLRALEFVYQFHG